MHRRSGTVQRLPEMTTISIGSIKHPFAVCLECKGWKRIDSRGMCFSCYKIWRTTHRHLVRGDDSYVAKSCTCHPHRKHVAHGLCSSCILELKKKLGPFADCHPSRPVFAESLCASCYTKKRRRRLRATCHPHLHRHSRDGLCQTCYRRREKTKVNNGRTE